MLPADRIRAARADLASAANAATVTEMVQSVADAMVHLAHLPTSIDMPPLEYRVVKFTLIEPEEPGGSPAQ